MSTELSSVKNFLSSRGFFLDLQKNHSVIFQKYAIYLIDHERKSSSTHKFWWDHVEDACNLLDVSVFRVNKDFRNLPYSSPRSDITRLFFFFTASSLHKNTHRVVNKNDVIFAFDLNTLKSFPQNRRFRIVFDSDKHREYIKTIPYRAIFWYPFAPVHLISLLDTVRLSFPLRYDFGYFGTVNAKNYDAFSHILIPLARKFRCIYRGLSWRRYKLPYLRPLFLGFSPFLVPDTANNGIEALTQSQINVVIHNSYHREAHTLTERIFYSSLLGRPIIVDNVGARRFFEETDMVKIVNVGAKITQETAYLFLSECEAMIRNLKSQPHFNEEIQRKTLEHHTYLNTVVSLLTQADRALRDENI